MTDAVDALADEMDAALLGTDNQRLRDLLNNHAPDELGKAVQRLRSRNLKDLNAATAAPGETVPLSTSSFQQREYELALLRKVIGA
jgi:hypothetical protein